MTFGNATMPLLYMFDLLLFVKGVQFKRVEALTRSKTVIDLKQNPPTLAEQAERFPITQSANPKGR